MSLINCKECQAQISEMAVSCPQCGHPLKLYQGFEWKSKKTILGWPFVHIAFGRDKQTGRLLKAKGIIAIGQFAIGLITIAQFGIGIIFGFGQFVCGILAIGQFAFGIYFGLGQFATGLTVIGQFALGQFVLAQHGLGEFVWSMKQKDLHAIEYFNELWIAIKGILKM